MWWEKKLLCPCIISKLLLISVCMCEDNVPWTYLLNSFEWFIKGSKRRHSPGGFFLLWTKILTKCLSVEVLYCNIILCPQWYYRHTAVASWCSLRVIRFCQIMSCKQWVTVIYHTCEGRQSYWHLLFSLLLFIAVFAESYCAFLSCLHKFLCQVGITSVITASVECSTCSLYIEFSCFV